MYIEYHETKSLWVNPWSLTEYDFHQQSMLNAFLFHFKKLFATHGKDGFYGFSGEPPEVMINLALGKPLFSDKNLRLTSLYTV